MRSHQRYLKLIIALLPIAITSCMVGPDFRSPASPRVQTYTESPLPKKTARTKAAGKAGQAQYFVSAEDISAEWWTLFHSPELNALIHQGIANNPNLGAAYASLRQAQEALNVQIGNLLFPAFNGSLSAERQRFSGEQFGVGSKATIFNLYNASVNVSYTLDLFGAARRQIENYRAQVDYQQFELIAAYLTLTSNIVTTAVTASAFEAQIQATHKLIQSQENQLAIIKKQFQLGGVSRENVLSQETLLAQTRATLPPLEKSLSQSLHALSVLVGDFPNHHLPIIHLDALSLPARLPVSLPSNLVRQRPDVRAQEALLHAASAQIGVATANLFPQLTITGGYGWETDVFPKLFNSINNIWNITGTLTQPIFHGGALFAARRQAIAAYDQAFQQYRQTVLQAFQNVADSLRAIETDARTLREQKQAEVSARNNLALTQKQYRLGGTSYLNLLIAQQQYQQAVINRISAQAARYNDTAALFQALGGGWWNRQWCVNESLGRC